MRSQSDALIKKTTKRPGRDVRMLLSKRLISGVSINIMMSFHQRLIFLILIVQTSEKGIILGEIRGALSALRSATGCRPTTEM